MLHVCNTLQFELLFCVQDKNDNAIKIVNTLKEKYPKVDSALFIGKNSNTTDLQL